MASIFFPIFFRRRPAYPLRKNLASHWSSELVGHIKTCSHKSTSGIAICRGWGSRGLFGGRALELVMLPWCYENRPFHSCAHTHTLVLEDGGFKGIVCLLVALPVFRIFKGQLFWPILISPGSFLPPSVCENPQPDFLSTKIPPTLKSFSTCYQSLLIRHQHQNVEVKIRDLGLRVGYALSISFPRTVSSTFWRSVITDQVLFWPVDELLQLSKPMGIIWVQCEYPNSSSTHSPWKFKLSNLWESLFQNAIAPNIEARLPRR
jgi:hypothetical protein